MFLQTLEVGNTRRDLFIKRFKKYVRKAGMSEAIHFHGLRHSGISWLINRGVSASFVSRLAGHSSLAMSQGYTHLEDQNLVGAIRVFDDVKLSGEENGLLRTRTTRGKVYKTVFQNIRTDYVTNNDLYLRLMLLFRIK